AAGISRYLVNTSALLLPSSRRSRLIRISRQRNRGLQKVLLNYQTHRAAILLRSEFHWSHSDFRRTLALFTRSFYMPGNECRDLFSMGADRFGTLAPRRGRDSNSGG